MSNNKNKKFTPKQKSANNLFQFLDKYFKFLFPVAVIMLMIPLIVNIYLVKVYIDGDISEQKYKNLTENFTVSLSLDKALKIPK